MTKKYCHIKLVDGKKVPNFGKKWGAMKKGDANAAFIQTGNGLTVIDLDSKKIPKHLKKMLGDPTVETARGYHWYITHDKDTKFKTIAGHEENVDVRSAGGLVFCDYWGDEDSISYNMVGEPIELTKEIHDYLPVKVKRETAEHRNGTEKKSDVKKALKNHSPDCSYDEWMKILAAIYDGLGSKGKKVAKKWSAQSDKFDEGAFEDKWYEIESGSFGEEITAASLYYREPDVFEPVTQEQLDAIEAQQKKIIDALIDNKGQKDNNFNWDLLPDFMSDFAMYSSVSLQQTPESWVGAMLSAASMCIRKDISIYPNGWGGKKVVPSLWNVNVGGASSGKSAITTGCTSPIDIKDEIIYKEYVKKLQDHEMKGLSVDKKNKPEAYVKWESEKPIYIPIGLSAVTKQALAQELGRTAKFDIKYSLIRDELESFFQNNHAAQELQNYALSLWVGKAESAVTIGRGVDRPKDGIGFSITGNTTRSVMQNIIKEGSQVSTGILARFQLISQVENINDAVEIKEMYTQSNSDEFKGKRAAVEEKYNHKLLKLFKDKRTEITFDKTCNDIDLKILELIASTRGYDPDALATEYIGKIKSTVPVIATVLHLLENKKGSVVGGDTFRRAYEITLYFFAEAKEFYDFSLRHDKDSPALIAEGYLDKLIDNKNKLEKMFGDDGKIGLGKFQQLTITSLKNRKIVSPRVLHEVIDKSYSHCFEVEAVEGKGYNVIWKEKK